MANMTEDVLKQITDLFTLIGQHELTISALKAAIFSQVQRDTGVDLSAGEWDLNLGTGELTPKEEEKEA